MLVRVKVQTKTHQLGGVWGVRTATKLVRWDDESSMTSGGTWIKILGVPN